MKKAGAEGTSYVMIKCPFKLIYKMEFELIRREDKHIHTVDHTENDWVAVCLSDTMKYLSFFNFIYKTC